MKLFVNNSSKQGLELFMDYKLKVSQECGWLTKQVEPISVSTASSTESKCEARGMASSAMVRPPFARGCRALE